MTFIARLIKLTRIHLAELFLAAIFGFALPLSVFNYVPFLWGRSLYIQLGFIIVSAILAAGLIYLILFRYLSADKTGANCTNLTLFLWPALVLGLILRSLISLPLAAFSPIHPYNLVLKPSDIKNTFSHTYDINLLDMKVDGLGVHLDDVTPLPHPSEGQKGMLLFEGEEIPGFSYRIENGRRAEKIELIFVEMPDAGMAQVTHQNRLESIDLHQIVKGERLLAIDLVADARDDLLWPLADALVISLVLLTLFLGLNAISRSAHPLIRLKKRDWGLLSAAVSIGLLLMLSSGQSATLSKMLSIAFIFLLWIANILYERLALDRFLTSGPPQRLARGIQLFFNAILFLIAGMLLKAASPVLFSFAAIFAYVGVAVFLWPRGTLLRRLIYVVPFLGLSLWFRQHDFWNSNVIPQANFFLAYNILRLVFAAYFVHILYGAGALFSALVERKSKVELSWLNRLIFNVFTGAALLRIIAFLLGLANLYYWETAISLGLIILFLSADGFFAALRQGWMKTQVWMSRFDDKGRRDIVLLFIALGAAAFSLFAVKGTYMVDHDYRTHYGPYLDEVIARHGLSLNGYWYHFYYSKGASLEILAMLLTDKMAVTLLSVVFVLASALLLFSLVKRFSRENLWGFIASLVYIGAFLLPDEGYFERHHAVNGVNILYIIWLCITQRDARESENPLRLWSGIFSAISLVILSWPSVIYVVPVLFFYGLAAWRKSKRLDKNLPLIWLVTTGLTVIALLVFNYLVTGFVDHVGLWFWLRFWDQARTAQWTSNYLWLWLLQGSGRQISTNDMSFLSNEFLYSLLRLKEITFLLPGVLFTILLLYLDRINFWKKISSKAYVFDAFIPALLMLGLMAFSAIFGGFTTSTLRAGRFVVFFIILALIALWQAIGSYIKDMRPDKAIYSYSSFVIYFLIAGMIVQNFFVEGYNLTNLQNRFLFSLGQVDLIKAYDNYELGSDAWVEMRQIIGADAQIADFSVLSDLGGVGYLLGKGLYNPVSYSYGKDWHILAFGDITEVKQAYRASGIDYFYIEDEDPPFDMLAYNDIFDPQTMKQYFKLVWSRPHQYLLTWQDNRKVPASPIPDDFIDKWGQLRQGKYETGLLPFYPHLLYERLAYIYRLNGGKTYDISVPADLPAVQGWQ